MSHLFADIFDGIRLLRILKGVPEKDILDYVQSRVGNMKVGNVLKTIRTLRKLVEEGILIKRGKRYSLSGKYPQPDCYDSEEETQGDDGDDREGDEEDNKDDDECQEDEEDEEEEDDDDGCGDEDDEDDFDDEDDDDDDDICNKTEGNKNNGNNGTNKSDENREERYKTDNRSEAGNGKDETNHLSSKESFVVKPKVGDEDNKNQTESTTNNTGKNGASNSERPAPLVLVSEPERKKRDKRKRKFLERKATKRKSQESAFCARDFIDSLEGRSRENFDAMDLSQGNTESRERVEKFISRHRGSRLKHERESRSSYRSRSPVTNRNTEFYNGRNKARSDEMGYRLSRALLQDPVDAEDVSEEPKGRGKVPEEEIIPSGGFSTEVPELQPHRSPSCSSSIVELKQGGSVEECSVVSIPQNKVALGDDVERMWTEIANQGQERSKRGLLSGRGCYVNRSESLCSVCDKKRRNS